MITEDYVSFETAKLLKEKGFEGFTMFSYSTKWVTMCGHWENETDWLPKCTLQMAMKWLREVHNIHIDICSIWDSIHWLYQVFVITPRTTSNSYVDKLLYTSYEQAIEAAIKYSLENLI
jgi:hypothetical protein